MPGHWESGLIISMNGATCSITLVERMSCYVTILPCPMGKDSASIADILIEHTREMPEMMRPSLAWDHGSEMAHHAALSLTSDLPVYFADPRLPWQRSSNEKTNR